MDTSAIRKKAATLGRILKDEGVRSTALAVRDKLAMLWRQGERWEVARFLGRPSPVVRLDGCLFTIDASLVPHDVRAMLLSGNYERAERVAVQEFLDPGLPVVELGACVGVVSCLTNRRLRDPTRHVVVEANPHLIPVLDENRLRNRCHFAILHRVVAYSGSTSEFYVHDDGLNSSARLPGGKRIHIAPVTLASILDDREFARANLVCDIEGGEVDLLRHESATLQARVATIILEIHPHRIGLDLASEVEQRLEQLKFRLLRRDWDTCVFENTCLGMSMERPTESTFAPRTPPE